MDLAFVINDDHASILHGYKDTSPQRYWDHEFNLLGLRNAIGHETVGSAYPKYPTIKPKSK